ncbi:RluA family pseudouridine synthase [Pelagicoccus sp. SDUM812005]|uniref:RluA family pseudouridine synthase n=1 Tax=Pelagicoccus sp. SDUM812005 TaxID=3041257 RepID=UPI0028107BE8|nr:RluA family pseudouridine synthase [Pelagicoccus sp. SDUM812005]MDQ8183244.1 RluA family pseudouridine synthase [Pelagicoccus sp. SDUM812005]
MANRTLPSPSESTGLLAHLFIALPDSKRTRLKDLLRSGFVHVNGQSVTRHDVLVGSRDLIEIRTERVAPRRALPFEVLYEDGALLVVVKPNGLLTVPSKHEKSRNVLSLVNAALRQTREHAFIVHRLDLYTSGVLVLVKSEEYQAKVMKHWAAAKKVYHALVEGRLQRKVATLTHFLREDERLVMHASESQSKNSVMATLSYRVVAERGEHSLLSVQLKTGKKNQIRSQLAAIGHPVAGDLKYGARSNPMGRLALHASKLWIPHPKTGALLEFEAPLPRGMEL